MNDTPYFDGSNYVSMDGNPYPDYSGALNANIQLVSTPHTAFYNPSSPIYDSNYDMSATVYESSTQVLSSGAAGKADASGGWSWLTPLVGGVVNAAGQIAEIEVQNRVNLANQDAARRLAAASNKVTPPAATSNTSILLPLALAAGVAFVLSRG